MNQKEIAAALGRTHVRHHVGRNAGTRQAQTFAKLLRITRTNEFLISYTAARVKAENRSKAQKAKQRRVKHE